MEKPKFILVRDHVEIQLGENKVTISLTDMASYFGRYNSILINKVNLEGGSNQVRVEPQYNNQIEVG